MSALAECHKSRRCLMELINRPSIPFEKSAQPKGDKEILKVEENLHEKFASYIQALTGSTEPISLVWMEHSYARAWRSGGTANASGGLSGGGARTLLVRRAPRCPDCHGEDHNSIEIDIETFDKEPEPPIPRETTPPLEKALGETETEALSDKDDDWEDKLENLAPTMTHHKLLLTALDCIKGLRVMRLSGALRGADHFARRLRRALASVWAPVSVASQPPSYQTQQQKPATWLHAVLSTYLPKPFLECYIDIVVILKMKIPTLMEQMLAGHHVNIPPAARSVSEQFPPLNVDDDGPLLVFIPSGREAKDARWAERFKAVLPVVRVNFGPNSNTDTVVSMAASAVAAGRSKVLSLMSQKANRRIVLVGHGVGALFAAQVAVNVGTGIPASLDGPAGSLPPAAGVVGLALLAPPLLTWAGRRGMPDDCLLDLNCPTLIVVGQNAMQCDVEEAESLRSRLGIWSRLVVVGEADDQLRLDYFKCCLEKVTQEMVECALADELGMFVKSACQWAECPTPPTPPAPPGPPVAMEHHSHNGEDVRSGNRRRAAGLSSSPPHIKRQRHSEQPTTPIKGGDEDATVLPSKQIISPSLKGRGDVPKIQITSNRIIRKFDHPIRSQPGKTIKVLDNLCIVGSGGRSTIPQIKVPAQRLSLMNSPAIDASLQNTPTALTSTNIMDIPIIFADDGKELVNLQPTPISAAPISIRTTNITSPAPVSRSNVLYGNNTISVRRSNLSTPFKYSKVILAKRPTSTSIETTATNTPATAATQASTSASAIASGKILGRPIIVRGRSGNLTAFRVMPANSSSLVIKRANVITGTNIKAISSVASSKVVESNDTPKGAIEENAGISPAETEKAALELEKQTEAMSENIET